MISASIALIRRLGLDRERILLIIRYGVAGVCGIVVQVGAFYVWISILGLAAHYLLGSAVALGFALLTTFGIQKYWTFKDTTHDRIHLQFATYFGIALGNLGISTGLIHLAKLGAEALGVDFFGGWYYVAAQGAIVVFVAFLSFLANYYITFKGSRSGSKL
ncbi:MAG: hypothetical protein ABA06_04700 [Parcubacteria bacterium C7867-001]|nr:MAG: hypothetical protein ABA06_04700 [Parcubacteria bacterium C7867-001]